jgi:murein DD-endopeptidase MepM/ murein hydrolase activator NlpD
MEALGLLFDNQKDVIERQLLKMQDGRTAWMFGYRIHPIRKNPDGSPLRQFHNGVDLPNPEGYPIKLPLSGTLIKFWLDDKFGGGNSIVFTHTNATFIRTGYAHLHNFADGLIMGSTYPAGTVIGYVGNTGVGTGPHLHFTGSQIVNGQSQQVDPLPFLCSACGVAELPIHPVG